MGITVLVLRWDEVLELRAVLRPVSLYLIEHARLIEVADETWHDREALATVGYGDVTPSSVAGRITAAILMFVGIGVVGVVTGLVASLMLDESAETKELQARLTRIEAMLESLTGTPVRPELQTDSVGG